MICECDKVGKGKKMLPIKEQTYRAPLAERERGRKRVEWTNGRQITIEIISPHSHQHRGRGNKGTVRRTTTKTNPKRSEKRSVANTGNKTPTNKQRGLLRQEKQGWVGKMRERREGRKGTNHQRGKKEKARRETRYDLRSR